MVRYVVRVWLSPNPEMGYRPRSQVWRDIALDETHTLAALHDAVFEAFGRWDDQDYRFVTRNAHGMALRSYVPPALYDGGPSWPAEDPFDVDRYLQQVPTAPDDAKDRYRELRTDPPDEGDAAATTIEALELKTLGGISYEFDLDRGWTHHIELREATDGSVGDEPTVVGERGPAPDQYPALDEE